MLYYFLFPKTLTNSGTTLIRGEGEGIPAKVLFRLFFFENNKSVLTSVLSLQSVSTNFVADCLLEKSCFIPFMWAAKVHIVHQYDLMSEIFFIALKKWQIVYFSSFLA